MFHDSTGASVAELDDVERAGNILQIGLGKTALAVFDDLHAADNAGNARRTVISRRLMGIGSVAQIVCFFITDAGDLEFSRKISDILFKVA